MQIALRETKNFLITLTFHWHIANKLQSCCVTQRELKTTGTCCPFSGWGVSCRKVCHSYYMQLITWSTVDRCVGILRWLEFYTDCRRNINHCCLFMHVEQSRKGKELHCERLDSQRRLCPPKYGVTGTPIPNLIKMILPPLHINMGLKKNSVKVVNKSDEVSSYWSRKLPSFSSSKVKRGIFAGPCSTEMSKGNWTPSNHCFVTLWATITDENYPNIVQSLGKEI